MPEIIPIDKYMTEDLYVMLDEFSLFTENILRGADLVVYLGVTDNPTNPEFGHRGVTRVGVVCQSVKNSL